MNQISKYAKTQGKKWREASYSYGILASKRMTIEQSWYDYLKLSHKEPEYVKKVMASLEVKN